MHLVFLAFMCRPTRSKAAPSTLSSSSWAWIAVSETSAMSSSKLRAVIIRGPILRLRLGLAVKLSCSSPLINRCSHAVVQHNYKQVWSQSIALEDSSVDFKLVCITIGSYHFSFCIVLSVFNSPDNDMPLVSLSSCLYSSYQMPS